MTFFHWPFAFENLLPVELHKLADYRFKLVQSGDQMTPNTRMYALGGSKLSEQLQSKRLAILLYYTILHALQMALKRLMILFWLYVKVLIKSRLHIAQAAGRVV